MSRRITIIMSCGTVSLGAIFAAGCGKDANGESSAATKTSGWKTVTAPATTATEPRKSTKPSTSTTSTTAAKPRGSTKPTRAGKATKAPKPTKAAKPPKASVLKRATLVVVIKRDAFAPSKLRGKVRQKITWLNSDKRSHNVTATEGATFASGKLAPGGQFAYTPTNTGRIRYVCTIHGQRGTINVIR